jgi:hypothetical protein
MIPVDPSTLEWRDHISALTGNTFVCWRPANAPILPGLAESFHIGRRMPLQGWPTTVHQSVVC